MIFNIIQKKETVVFIRGKAVVLFVRAEVETKSSTLGLRWRK